LGCSHSGAAPDGSLQAGGSSSGALASLNPGGVAQHLSRVGQNWIGGTRPGNARFVPPAPALVEECMVQLEQFTHGGHHGEHAPAGR
jgi:hypothetical protein